MNPIRSIGDGYNKVESPVQLYHLDWKLRRIPVSLGRAIEKWTKQLDKAIKTGKGKYSHITLETLYSYRRIIQAIEDGKLRKARQLIENEGTPEREDIPARILEHFETH